MPLNLAHLLNSTPVSPPRSHAARAPVNNGPEPALLTELLSPTARAQQLDTDRGYAQPEAAVEDAEMDDAAGVVFQKAKASELRERGEFSFMPETLNMPVELCTLPQSTSFTLPAPVFNGHFQFGTQIRDPTYQRPVAMNSYSYLKGRNPAYGSRRYESLKPMNFDTKCIGFDLHAGIEDFTYRDVTVDEGLDDLLTCLTNWVETRSPNDPLVRLRRLAETEFVTWRGMMTKICSAVYESSPNDGWEMNAMMVNGTIYIEENVSPAAIANQVKDNAKMIPSYYGHSYESLMTSPPGRFDGVDTNVQWVSVVKANLNNIKLILGGEVDCVKPEAMSRLDNNPKHEFEIQPEDFVEIKTCGLITSDRDRWTFQRYKMIKFWLQSFLLGTPIINIGFRDRAGKVCKSESLVTREIPALVKHEAEPSARWSGSMCLDTGANVLKFIKEHINPARHEGLARFEEEFKHACACSIEKKKNCYPKPPEPTVLKWQRWPVFRIKLLPRAQSGKKGARSRIEIRELDFGSEVMTEVMANRRPGDRIGFLPQSWFLQKIKEQAALIESEL